MKRGIPYFLLAFTSLFLIKDSVEQRILEYKYFFFSNTDVTRIELIPINNKQLLISQKMDGNYNPFVLIPGYMHDFYNREENDGIVSKIVPILKSDEIKEAKEIARENGFIGTVNFWR